ncbi:MAG: HAD hydrolase family protein [Bacillota bacterium]|nr:HAD hydrolase family protein [Bacillota bacterium]
MRNNIKLFVMDVDGTLTDGKIYISEVGELFKAFDVKDGYAIKNIMPQHGIIPVIITGRISRIVETRAKELNITEIYQGICDKVATFEAIRSKFGITYDEIASIGDDLNDLEIMKLSGISACPSDSCEEVKKHANIVLSKKGGAGAVREFVERLTE